MKPSRRGLGLETIIGVALLALLYAHIRQQVPFFHAWDMDWTTALDVLVIQSGGLPDHVNHPGFAMYLLLTWSHRAAFALDQVSFLDLEDVRQAGNPIVGAAELTEYLRAHSPLVLVVLVLAQVFALAGVARMAGVRGDALRGSWARSGLFPLLVLLLVGVQEGVLFHAGLIRSEVYAVLFWCLALVAGVAALRARTRRTSALRFGLCGLFLAVSWTTKLQGLLLIAWLLLLLLVLRELGWSRSPILALEPARGRFRLLPGVALLAPAVLLILGASRAVAQPGMATFVESYSANSAALLLLAAFSAPLVLASFQRRLPALDALLAGALGAALLHLLIYADLRTGLDYLLLDAKMLLFRTNYQSLDRLDPLRALTRLAEEAAAAPGAFVVHGCLLALAVRGLRSRRLEGWVLLAELGLLCHIGLATRSTANDAIWSRLPLGVWTVILAITVLARPRSTPTRVAGVFGLLALALLAQAREALAPAPPNVRALEYNWQVERWLEGVYSDGDGYAQLIAVKADPADRDEWGRVAAALARDWAQTNRDLRHTLFNQPGASLRDLTTAHEGFVLPHDDGARLVAVPTALRGGFLVRPAAWTPRVLADGVLPPSVAVVGRPDLEVVLFLPAGAPAPPVWWVAGPEHIDVATPSGVARFDAFRAGLYGEVDVSRLGGGAFVLVKRRF